MGTIIAARPASGRVRPIGEDVSRGTSALEAWRSGPHPATAWLDETPPTARSLAPRVPLGCSPPRQSPLDARPECGARSRRCVPPGRDTAWSVSYTHLRAHET